MHKLACFLTSVAVGAGLLLTACGGATTTAPQPTQPAAATESPPTVAPTTEVASPEPSQEPVTIKILNYSQERVDFYKEAVAEFHKEYPWVTVQWDTMVEDDYNNNLPLMFAGGDAPDIFVYFAVGGDYYELSELLANEWVQPLDDAALPANFRDRFPGTFDMLEGIYSKDGKVYAIPRPPSTGTAGYAYMYYNKDVIEQAGLTDNIPTTWQEFHDACVTIKEKTGAYCMAVPMVEAGQMDRLSVSWFSFNIPGGWDASWISPRTGKYSYLTDPAFVETLEYLRGLYEEDLVLPGLNDKVFSRQAIANGQAAFYFDGGWMSSVFPSTFQFTNFGVAVPPAKDKQGYVAKIVQGPPPADTFISSQSKHPYEATLFLEWMTRPDGWFTQHFMAYGFDVLPWGDPLKNADYLPADNLTRELVPLDPLVHVVAPQPALKCPDLSKSEARTKAIEIHPDWEFEAMIEYLLSGGDWLAKAKEIEDARNEIFEETLSAEAAQGLKVSTDCFAEPTWDGLTNFDYGAYSK